MPCECKISNVLWDFFQFVNTCTVKVPFKVTNDNTTIATINGYSQPNEKVRFFSVTDKVVNYIPKGLNLLFVKLIGMKFDQTSLKLVTKENLQPFPDLLMFSSTNNQIEFLEKDLFIYNPKLQYVSFSSNKITYIDPNVFKVLSSTLAVLMLDRTAIDCGLSSASDPNSVAKLLNKVSKSACAKIENAPPLYSLWLKMKEGKYNQGKNSFILSLLKTDYLFNPEYCEEQIAIMKSECDDRMIALENEYNNFLICALDPSAPNCLDGVGAPTQ